MLSATPPGHVLLSFQRPNLDSNQDQDLRTVLCCPLHHRDSSSHQEPTTGFAPASTGLQDRRLSQSSHVGWSSTSARSRKSVRQFWRLAALPGAHSCRVKSSRRLEPGAIVFLLLRQFNVPVRLADELRPAFDPQLVSRVQRVPRRLDRLLAQSHSGLLGRAVGLPLVARQAGQHAVVPPRLTALGPRHDVVDRQFLAPRLPAVRFTIEPISGRHGI